MIDIVKLWWYWCIDDIELLMILIYWGHIRLILWYNCDHTHCIYYYLCIDTYDGKAGMWWGNMCIGGWGLYGSSRGNMSAVRGHFWISLSSFSDGSKVSSRWVSISQGICRQCSRIHGLYVAPIGFDWGSHLVTRCVL